MTLGFCCRNCDLGRPCLIYRGAPAPLHQKELPVKRTRLEDANDDLNLALTRLQSIGGRMHGATAEALLEVTRVVGNLAVTHAMLYDLLLKGSL